MTYQEAKHNRLLAKEAGHKTYNGRPCKVCGSEEKYVSNNCCKQCTQAKTNNRSPEVFKKYATSDRGKQRNKEYRKTRVHKDVQNNYKRRHYAENKDQYKNNHLKKYGITLETYKILLENQNGVCYVCEEPPGTKQLAVDHDHDTGEVRKLLCNRCNTALGLLKEDVNIMNNLIRYVKDHK